MIIELLFSLNEHKNTLCAETAEYPSMLARSARFQIFATKNIVFYNYKFLQQKRCFYTFLQQKRFFTNFATKNCSFLQLHENKHFHGATHSSQMILVHMLQ